MRAQEGTWGIVDARGELVGSARFANAASGGFASNGLAAAMDAETGLWGYVRWDGDWSVEPSFAGLTRMSGNGYALAKAS